MNRRDEEVRAITRRELRDNLLACLGCVCIGALIGLFIGLSLRFH